MQPKATTAANDILRPGKPATRLQKIAAWLGATGAIALLSWALILLHADASTAGILYLVMIVWTATFAGSVLSIYLAILASLLFDFLFLQPLYTLNLSGFQAWLAMFAFLASCVVVNRVAERARRQTQRVQQRSEDAERLYSLSQEMMLHDDAAGLVRDIPRLVETNFALNAVLLYVRAENQLYASGLILNGPDPSESATDALHEEMRVSLEAVSAALEANSELPHGFSPLNLVFGMNSVGTLAWKPATLSREVAASVAAQVAIAITRAHAIERSARLEAARSADRLRSALIDSLTHELRTPLTAIRAAATSLVSLERLDDETRTELASIVDEESARLDILIGEAMEVAQIESAGIRIKLEPNNPGTFLEQAIAVSRAQLAKHRITITQPKAEIRLEGPVWFDPHVIGRVLRHLLENAARYTPAGSRIQLSYGISQGRLEFLVEDNGPGIHPKDLPLIFDKFYRGKQRLSGGKGSGMGLAIARALMTVHGGGVEAESSPGHGASFRIWVPLAAESPTGS